MKASQLAFPKTPTQKRAGADLRLAEDPDYIASPMHLRAFSCVSAYAFRFCVGAGYEFRRLRMAQAARHDASASPKSCGSTRLVPKT